MDLSWNIVDELGIKIIKVFIRCFGYVVGRQLLAPAVAVCTRAKQHHDALVCLRQSFKGLGLAFVLAGIVTDSEAKLWYVLAIDVEQHIFLRDAFAFVNS